MRDRQYRALLECRLSFGANAATLRKRQLSHKARAPEKALDCDGPSVLYRMSGFEQSLSGQPESARNVHLSFYPDAKIGVLGVNGAGNRRWRIRLASARSSPAKPAAEGARVGYLPQEPQLDSTNQCANDDRGRATEAILERYKEIAANYSDETADEMTKLQDEINQGLWDIDSKIIRYGALRCPPDDAEVKSLRW
jgi:ATPase subunit of ABC transporter with duplicated ATPase domains